MLNLVIRKVNNRYLVYLNTKLFYFQNIYSNILFKNISKNFYFFSFVIKVLYKFGFIPLHKKIFNL